LEGKEEGRLEGKEEGRLEGKEEGREEGREEGQRLMVENLLEGRFGSLDEQLSQIIEPMMQLPPRERIQLLLNLSREELLTRFRG
ncbi:MAG: hypothetical protein SAL07_14785, partial [Oscillatoria sp. PMC 1051.18]|nr:hypothetical protein [Oscillatoria sp. PMC 1050.18]MEC5031162.1 hypothetical protein [Oscillatoria sp. PMC 1051.18]